VKVLTMPSGQAATARWKGMHLNVHFYWTSADTASALVSAGGAMLGLFLDRIYRRLVRR
jgi:hypothetical protein